MKLVSREAAVEITPISGVLRVLIRPRPNYLVLLVEAALIIVFVMVTVKRWHEFVLWNRVIFLWVEASGVLAWFYQLSGEEELEFGPRHLVIRKATLGWVRRREYPTEKCSQLEWLPESDETRHRLQCKIGWRPARFGEYISERQAMDILAALQQYLPTVAQTMGTMPGSSRSQITTLGLS